MNKKFLSAILFGALMVSSTGTFVSCKDYDDDVTELWDAINGQKTDLTAKVTAVETSISSLQTAQTALDGKITEAKTAAEKAALEAQKAAIAAAQAELAAAKTELEASIAKLQDANEAEVAAVKEDVKKTVAAIAEVDGKVIALQAFQATTEKTLEALAAADATLAGTLGDLDDAVKRNAENIGKNKVAIEAQVEALQKYIASNDVAVAANKAAIDSAVDELEGYKTLLESLNAFDVEKTQQEIATLTSNYAQLSTDISTINDTLEILSAAVYKGVTHVSLVASTNSNNFGEPYAGYELKLLSSEAVRTWTFGDKLAGAVSFVKGERTTFDGSFLIRVSPTDAVISAENIKLINSKGADLEGLVEVSDVKPYTDLLTRGVSANGLWTVSVKMNADYDEEAFTAATTVPTEDAEDHILYAVSLNTTLAEGKTSRNVVSEYDITFSADEVEAAKELGFTVDGTAIASIHNRATKSEETSVKTPVEYVWTTNDGVQAEPIFEGDDMNVVVGDNRQEQPILPVELKKAFTVQLDEATMAAASAFYIVLDKDRAVSSDDSEIVAWETAEPSISGINQVYSVAETKGKVEILINNNVKDVYGFRVYAVNNDGSLIDPDGRAFYVVTGDAAEELSGYSVKKTWSKNDESSISRVAVAEGVFGDWMANVETVDYVASEIDTVAYGNKSAKKAFTIKYASAEGGELNEFSKSTKAAVKFITIATTEGAEDYWYDDNKTYTRTLAFKNDRGQVLKTLTVNYKKELPAFPTTFQAKVNQLNAEGTLDAFMNPIENGDKGEKDLTQSFNGLYGDDNFIITFDDVMNADGDLEDITAESDYTFKVANKAIDNTTKHAVTVAYNFGKISSEAGYTDSNLNNYTVKGGDFKNIIFSCLAKLNDYDWTAAPSLTYAQEDGKTLLSNIKSVNKRDGKYSTTLDKLLTGDCDNMIKGLSDATYELWSQVAKDGAIKEGSKNEYFTPGYAEKVTVGKVTAAGITFTPNSEAQNPEATVYSTLIIKAKDYFNHDVVIKINNVEVKKR